MTLPPRPREPKNPPAQRAISPRIETLIEALQGNPDGGHASAFWREVAASGAPIIEPDPTSADHCTMTFVWRAPSAAWHGDAYVLANKLTPVSAPDMARMHRIAATDIHHATYRVPRTWRGSYRLTSVDHGTHVEPAELRAGAQADPLCREHIMLSNGAFSLTSMPDAPAQPWAAGEGTPLHLVDLPAPALATGPDPTPTPTRACFVHATPAPAGEQPRTLIVLLDGEAWGLHPAVGSLFDHLVATGAMEPALIVAPSAGDIPQRWREMGAASEGLLRFLTHDVPAWFARETGAPPRDALIAGQSLGALTAARALGAAGSPYRAALLQSPSLWMHDNAPVAEVTDLLDAARGRVHLGVGSDEWVLLPRARLLRDALTARGVPFTYSEWSGGHDVPCWLDGIAAAVPPLLERSSDE